jgi:para-nitrobenzyl esterase
VTGASSELAHFEGVGISVADQVGCSGASDVLACLRKVPAKVLWEADADAVAPSNMVSVDGAVLPRPVLELMAETGGTVPLLLGSNREEEGWFRWVLENEGPTFDFDAYVLETSNTFGPLAGRVRDLYTLAIYGDYITAMIASRSDAMATCPVREVARASQKPTYRYLFARALDDEWLGHFGSAHGIDNLVLWGGYDWYEMSEAEALLATRMQSYLVNFARHGDPNGDGLPAWPSHSAAEERLIVLDDDMTVLEDGFHNPECDLLEGQPIDPICNAGCRRAQMWERRAHPSGGPKLEARPGLGGQAR